MQLFDYWIWTGVCDINSVNNPGLTDNISHVLLYFWMIYHYIMCWQLRPEKNRSLNSYINKFISLSCSSSSALMWSNIVLALGLKITGLLGTSGYISCDIYSADLTKETVPECKLPLACNWPNVHYSNSDIILVYDSILSTVFWFWAWIMHRATYCCFICLTSLDT